MTLRKNIKDSKRIVFKFGTNTLTSSYGNIALSRVYSFVEAISELKRQGKEIIIVTSGAVGMGAKKLNTPDNHDPISLKQAYAAIGQGLLMHFYQEAFDKFNITSAQVLLTADDFSNRRKYLSLRNTLNTLLELGAIPVINENDVISSSELECYKESDTVVCFGDNDKLSALVTSKLDADLLVILSDIDGFYNGNPKKDKNAKVMNLIHNITPEFEKLCFEKSSQGRGGMVTKLEAAKVAMNSGSMVIIANGKEPGIIEKIFEGRDVGTLFLPTDDLSSKKKWIAYATNINSYIIVNDGAKKALVDKKASLMPIGILKIQNAFEKGDVIGILDEQGNEFARGMTNYASQECKKVIGKNSEEIEKILGFKNYDTVITRDNIVVL